MILTLLHYFHIIDIAYAAPAQVSITDLSFSQMIVIFAKLLETWVGIPLTLFLWFRAGFLYVIAEGSPDKLKSAHDMIKISVIVTVGFTIIYGLLLAASDGLSASL